MLLKSSFALLAAVLGFVASMSLAPISAATLAMDEPRTSSVLAGGPPAGETPCLLASIPLPSAAQGGAEPALKYATWHRRDGRRCPCGKKADGRCWGCSPPKMEGKRARPATARPIGPAVVTRPMRTPGIGSGGFGRSDATRGRASTIMFGNPR